MKKILILCLSLFLAISTCLFVACDSGNGGTGNGNSEPASTPTESDNPSTPTESESTVAEMVTVRFLVDGDVYETVTGEVGSRIVTPKTKPTKEHQNFVKWDGYTNGERYSENKDFTAIFEDIIYKVEFVSLGKIVTSIEGKYGETFTVPEDPTAATGYTFKGWQDLDLNNLVIEDNKQYIAIWDYETPSIAYASTGTFNADTLEKDSIFDNATLINKFQSVQNNENDSYELYLVNDGEYLYIYIYSADTDYDDIDRLCFYLVKKGATQTTSVQTYPNNGMSGASGTDSCVAINAGKVDGGYALKAKVALSSIEVDEENNVAFSVRLINNANDGGGTHAVYLNEGAVADDSSNTKVNNPVNLPKYELAKEVKE